MEPPPGGPPDVAPPQLVSTRPDSMAQLPGFSGDVEFRFDEVISEGGSPSQGTGSGDLEKLIILSPTVRVPDVRWRRTRITVKPDEGWKRDRVYRVQLLPGVTDLRRNRSNKGTILTFTTGAPLPTRTLEGMVVDWSTSRPAVLALVDALLMPDSLPYRGLTDSTGRYSLGPLPAGDYLVKGVIDEDRDFQPDVREAFDTVRVSSKDSVVKVTELWTFVHDTTPPRIRTITMADSVSATVEFNQLLDPRQKLDAKSATLRLLPDSSVVPVISLLAKPVDDSIHGRSAGAPDSTALDSTRRDTTRRERPGLREIERPGAQANQPLTSRPRLFDQLVLRVRARWKPEAKYELEVRGVRNVSGVAGDGKGVLTILKVEARDSLAKRGEADTLRPRIDSLGRPKDSLPKLKKRS
ncbi:MAG TPA: Ig-like domain-containing protein [Gemmatimonadales bacterium]